MTEQIEAFDLAGATMDQLIEKHNELKPNGQVDGFKSLKAARAAVGELLEQAANGDQGEATEAGEATEPAQPSANSTVERRGPVQGVGVRAKELILTGLTNKEVLAKILEEFPTAKTSYSCIAYYRNALRKAATAIAEPVAKTTAEEPAAETTAEEPAAEASAKEQAAA